MNKYLKNITPILVTLFMMFSLQGCGTSPLAHTKLKDGYPEHYKKLLLPLSINLIDPDDITNETTIESLSVIILIKGGFTTEEDIALMNQIIEKYPFNVDIK